MNIRSTINLVKAKAAVILAGRDVMQQTAVYLAAQARNYAPKDTGFLASEIQALPLGGGGWTVIAAAPYSQWVEFGHYSTAGVYIAPQPFMRLAMADAKQFFRAAAENVHIARPATSGTGFLSVSL